MSRHTSIRSQAAIAAPNHEHTQSQSAPAVDALLSDPALPTLFPTRPKSGRRTKRSKRNAPAPIASDPYRECLEQAEVCREQARVAAGLKRYAAARGLFATAIGLCQRAVGYRSQAERAQSADEAGECLRQLTIEMSTYSELAKSMERPLHSSKLSHGNATPASGS